MTHRHAAQSCKSVGAFPDYPVLLGLALCLAILKGCTGQPYKSSATVFHDKVKSVATDVKETWTPLPDQPSPYLQKCNLASFILEEIVALKPSFLNHGDRGGSFFVGVIVWNGNIKTGYEGLFDLGIDRKLDGRAVTAKYGTVPSESCNKPSANLWGALGYPCPAGASVYIRATSAGETTSCMVFYLPSRAVQSLDKKLKVFGEIMGACGNKQTLRWTVKPGSRAKINLTNLAICMYVTKPSGALEGHLNSFRGVATIAAYSPAGFTTGDAHSSHLPSDDYGAAAPLGFIATNSYDVFVPWNHPGNPEPGKDLQLAIYFFSAPYWH